ncbi:MAG: hypothetical protein JXX29_12120 [Deltaproteobacteria bacterium]|nr:hypothetical protein [Deltaproteobacteria bacterium]MBN2672419.1 hypothetical protein [Deltaproteobacteria bacterium]
MRNFTFLWVIGCVAALAAAGCGDDASGGGDENNNENDTNPPWEGTASYEEGPSFVAHEDALLTDIPETAIEAAKQNLHIVYQHTSHGSQLITGMNSLAMYPDYGDTYGWSDDGSGGLDLDDYGIPADCSDLSTGDSVDGNGDTPWVVGTRALLDDPANAHVNVVIWSWCSIAGHDAQRYVNNMEKLIAEYPAVHFIFMTGHAEGTGEDMTENGVHYNNQLIRDHCRTNNRWLFDFADIEAHNPDGNYYWSANMYDNLNYDGGNWGVEWIAANPAHDYSLLTTGQGIDGFDGTGGCAHSDDPTEANINCVQKAAAAWHLFARLAGWDPDA